MGLLAKSDKKSSETVNNPKTGKKKTVEHGAKGYSIAPGTSKRDSYCARSHGQIKKHPTAVKNPEAPLRRSQANESFLPKNRGANSLPMRFYFRQYLH